MRKLVLACALFTLLTACGNDDDPTGLEDISGTYTLVAVDGQALPKAVSIFRDGVTVKLVEGGTFQFLPGQQRYVMEIDVVYNSGGGSPDATSGYLFEDEYERNGNSITLASSTVTPIMAVFSNTAGQRTVTVTHTAPLGFGVLTFQE